MYKKATTQQQQQKDRQKDVGGSKRIEDILATLALKEGDENSVTTPSKLLRPLRTPSKTPSRTPLKSKYNFVHFGYDAELDSSPFTYMRSTATESAATTRTAINSGHSVIPTNTIHAVTDDSPSVDPIESSDLFGIGEFDEMFITEDDLERAKEKLEGEKSSGEVCLSILSNLLVHRSTSGIEECDDTLDATLIHNFHVVGRGRVFVGRDCDLVWDGQLAEFFDHEGSIRLAFKRQILSDIRLKQLDDEELILLMTVNDSMFIQFGFNLGLIQRDHVEKLLDTLKNTLTSSNNPIDELEVTVKQLREDAEQKRLTQIENIEKEYQDELNRIEELYKKELASRKTSIEPLQKSPISEDDQTNECNLCYNDTESILLVPCNHKMCKSCMELLQATGNQLTCPWDRAKVEVWLPFRQ